MNRVRIAGWVLVAYLALGAVCELRAQDANESAAQHNNEGVALASQERLQEAIRAFQKAIALAPDFAAAYYNLGLAHTRLQHYREAVRALSAAVQIQPDYGEAWYQLGIALQMQDQFEAASQAYETALRLNPHAPNVLYRLGYAFLRQKNWERAAAYWDRLIEANPGHPAVLNIQEHLPHLYFNLGTVRYLSGDLDGAEAALDRAMHLQPGYGDAQYNMGLVYQAQERYDEALRALQKARSLQPDNPDVALNLGRVYAQLENFAQAEAIFREMLTHRPNDLLAIHNLADALVRQGKQPEAIARALTVAHNKPNDPDSFKLLAFVYEHNAQGERYGTGFDAAKAEKAYQRALELKPDDATLYFNLGVLYGRLDNWTASYQVFRYGWAVDSTHAGLRQWMPEVQARYLQETGQE